MKNIDESKLDTYFMHKALLEAKKAEKIGEVPIGAVIVKDNKIIARGYNRREIDHDPLAHAEILAIKKAAKKLGRWRLSDCTLYVTLEPCPMCAGAIVNARMVRLVFGCSDPKAGAVQTLFQIGQDKRLNHCLKMTVGVEANASSHLLTSFFKKLRD